MWKNCKFMQKISVFDEKWVFTLKSPPCRSDNGGDLPLEQIKRLTGMLTCTLQFGQFALNTAYKDPHARKHGKNKNNKHEARPLPSTTYFWNLMMEVFFTSLTTWMNFCIHTPFGKPKHFGWRTERECITDQ